MSNGPTIRVVLLGRVSTPNRRSRPGHEDNQDPQTQLRVLRGVAANLGWEVVEELPLRMSAWDDRAAAKVRGQCEYAIQRGQANLLAVWSLDRVSREGAVKVLGFIEHLEAHYGCSFYSYQEPFLCTGTDPQQRELMLTLLAWVARWESQRRSERLLAKAASKRAHAEQLGTRGKWGRGSMPNEEDRARALELRANGKSLRAIARELELGLGTVHALCAFDPSLPPKRSNPPP